MKSSTRNIIAALAILAPPLGAASYGCYACSAKPVPIGSAVAELGREEIRARKADKALGGQLLPALERVISNAELSEPIVPGSTVRVPNDAGWKLLEPIWPDGALAADPISRDGEILRFCGTLQARREGIAALEMVLRIYNLDG